MGTGEGDEKRRGGKRGQVVRKVLSRHDKPTTKGACSGHVIQLNFMGPQSCL